MYQFKEFKLKQEQKNREHMVMLGVVLVIILISMASLPLIVAPSIAVGSSNIAGATTGTAAIGRNTIDDGISEILPFGCTIL